MVQFKCFTKERKEKKMWLKYLFQHYQYQMKVGLECFLVQEYFTKKNNINTVLHKGKKQFKRMKTRLKCLISKQIWSSERDIKNSKTVLPEKTIKLWVKKYKAMIKVAMVRRKIGVKKRNLKFFLLNLMVIQGWCCQT